MTSSIEDIPKVLNDFFKQAIENEKIYIKRGIAKNINEENFTFTFEPEDKSPDIQNVQMKSVASSDNEAFFQIPEEGSTVIIVFFDKTNAYALSCESVNRIVCTCNNFIWNEGELGGLINIEPLVEKINTIEDNFNSVLNWLMTHTHLHPQGPTLISPEGSELMQYNIIVTEREEIEDIKITH